MLSVRSALAMFVLRHFGELEAHPDTGKRLVTTALTSRRHS